jgi:ParB/RepB/Spo0J family partition protein
MQLPDLIPGQVAHIPVDMLDPDPNQPRKDFPADELKTLAANILARGVLQPIVISRSKNPDGKLIIKYGERRWRASKLAQQKTIPCLLNVTDDTNPIEYAFDQIAENHQRQNLNPIEWALFLKRLRDDFSIKITDIPAELEKHNVKMSRSYISNLIRLLGLPGWAQDKIASGELSYAHGKHLLTAGASGKVMKDLKKSLDKNNDITVADLEEEIAAHFGRHHIDLDCRWGERAVKFDVKTTCAGCESYRNISDGDMWHNQYCLNKECFDQKQKEAETKEQAKVEQKKKQAKKKKPTAADEERKQELRVMQLRSKMAEYLGHWLRNYIATHLVAKNKQLQMDMLVYMALNFPETTLEDAKDGMIFGTGSRGIVRERIDQAACETRLCNLSEVLTKNQDKHFAAIAKAGVESLLDDGVVLLSQHLKIKLEKVWRIDDAFIALLRKPELIQLLIDNQLYDENVPPNGSLPEIQARCLEFANKIQAPALLLELYNDTDACKFPGKRL